VPGRPTRIAVLGATGSIGRAVLDVVGRSQDRFEVVSLSAWSSVELLSALAASFGARRVAVGPGASRSLDVDRGVEVLEGPDALSELASDDEVDLVVNALVGAAGLRPTVAALERGKRIAIANKEPLVAAGDLVMSMARDAGVEIIPVDSEHSSIFRCLRGTPRAEVESVVLTASGGPLRDRTPEEMASAGLDEVLAHPTWNMGNKVTVDSASLANKAMEVIEAHWLFGMPFDRIEVVMHRESVVHSLVRLVDGSLLAHLGRPDMRIPIQYALSYPDAPAAPLERCDLAELGALHFERVDERRYPCFDLILQAGKRGGTAPAIAAAADEAAVAAFSEGFISFGDIATVVERTLDMVAATSSTGLDAVLEADSEARAAAESLIGRMAGAGA